jgi:hypothetical protein
MTAELDPLSLPSTCAVAWADKDSIYVRYPGPNGTCHIVRYQKTYTALTQAFGVLVENPMENRKVVPRHPTPVMKPMIKVSEDARAAARAAMKKAGII